jgi:septal ring factor EnvC (AmiA/AmiB activator)
MRAAERAFLFAAALAVAATGIATAQTPDLRAKRLERQLEEARARDRLLLQDRAALTREMQQLQDETAAAAAAIQAAEAAATGIERRLDDLEEARARSEGALEERRERLAGLLLAIERLARVPREALLLREQAPLDAARSGRLLAHAVPHVDGEARALRREIESLAATRAELASERERLAATRARLAAERARLDEMIERRTRLAAALDVERAALALRNDQLGRELGSVRELIETLAAQKLAAERTREAERALAKVPMAKARGQARAPVEGRVVAGWGQPQSGGQVQRGVSYEAAAGAIVVAPWHGAIAYAGPFRGYGVILIVESGDGYHWLISGLGRLDVVAGQAVRAGEPVGLAGAAGPTKTTVYVELRRNGQPIDPGPWLAAPNGKVSG